MTTADGRHGILGCGSSTGSSEHCPSVAQDVLSGFAWCEVFMLLGLHGFWILFKSAPLAVDNAWGGLYAFFPFLVMLGTGLCGVNRRFERALVRVAPFLHLLVCALQSLLLFYVATRDPLTSIVPLASPMFLWSIALSVTLVANLSTHLRTQATRGTSSFVSSVGSTVALVLVLWCGSLWMASGMTWAVYFWTGSILLHALLAIAGLLEHPSTVRSHRQCMTRWGRLSAGLDAWFLLCLILMALVRNVYNSAYMGSAETKYPLFLDVFAMPLFFAGLALFLIAARWRFALLTHLAVGALIVFTGKESTWPVAVSLGYALGAFFHATHRQGAAGYALSALLAFQVWEVALAGFLFSGLVIHFNYGLNELGIVLQWGGYTLFVLWGLYVLATTATRWRKPRLGDECADAVPARDDTRFCRIVCASILIAAIVPGACLLVATAWPPFIIERPLRQPVGEPMGVCHAGYSEGDDEYRTLDALGVQCLRADFPWSQIEPAPGQWDFASRDGYVDAAVKHGKRVIALLDFDNDAVETDPVGKKRGMYIAPSDVPRFLEYVRQVVTRYRGRVYAWEIWNEPDIERFWTGSMDEFYALARQTAETVRAVDGSARIIGTAMTGPMGVEVAAGIEGLHRSGALSQVDHPSCHLYVTDVRHYCLEFMKIISVARRFHHPGSIWITELGVPDGGYYPWGSDSEALAPRVIKAYTLATSFGMDMLVWYCFHDSDLRAQTEPPIEAERFFGLLGPDDRWKPSAYAYRLFSHACSNSTIRTDLTRVSGGLAARQLRSALYRRDSGESALVLWFEPMLRPWATARVRVNLGQIAEPAVVHDIASNYEKALIDDHIDVSDKPVFITFRTTEPETPVYLQATTSPVDTLWLLLIAGTTLGTALVYFRRRRLPLQDQQ